MHFESLTPCSLTGKLMLKDRPNSCLAPHEISDWTSAYFLDEEEEEVIPPSGMDTRHGYQYGGNRPWTPYQSGSQQQADSGSGYLEDHVVYDRGFDDPDAVHPGFEYAAASSSPLMRPGYGFANGILPEYRDGSPERHGRSSGQVGRPFTPQDRREEGQYQPRCFGSPARGPAANLPPGQAYHLYSPSRPRTPSAKFSTPGSSSGGLPLIFRTADGRYDERTIAHCSRPGSPASFRPGTPPVDFPQRYDVGSYTEPSSSPGTHQTYTRPRNDSNASSCGSRRGSVREMFRRGSEQLAHAASMLLPSRQERDDRAFSSRRYIDSEAPTPPPKGKKPTPAERAAKLRRDKERAYQKEAARYAAEAAAAAAHNRPPTPPPKSKIKERVVATGENLAGPFSRALGHLREKRKTSVVSDWSFADAGAGHQMATRCHGCGASDETVSQGLYGSSERNPRYERHADQSADHLARRSNSPSYARDVDEEDYVKVVGSHKMLRVRQTVYIDPGNPFDLGSKEQFEPWPLSRSHGTSPAMTNSSGFNPELSAELNRSTAAMDSSGFNVELEKLIGNNSGTSPTSSSSPTDSVVHQRGSPDVGMERFSNRLNVPLYAPKARRPGTPALVRAHSMKEVPIPVAPSPEPEEEEYIPPRSLWRRSLPSSNLCEAGGRVADVVRDTKFYGFYDGVLAEYRAVLEDKQ